MRTAELPDALLREGALEEVVLPGSPRPAGAAAVGPGAGQARLRLTVEPGQPLRVTLVNRGSVPHNLEFELPTGEVELEQNLPPGERRTLELTAPREPGRYVDYRPVGEHRQRGMEGTLLVQGAATR